MAGLKSLRTARQVAALRGRRPEDIADRYHLEALESEEQPEAATTEEIQE